jgi:hypothetical protein
MKKTFIFIFGLLSILPITCKSATEIVETPNTEVVDYYSMDVSFRLYSNGGILSKLMFGVFKRLNIGCSWDVDKLIGTQTPEARQPTLNLKFRIYDGSKNLPAFAIGYDGQGYNYNESSGTYLHKEKGIYFVSGMELLIKNLWFHLGSNINFSSDQKNKAEVFGFTSIDYSILDKEKKLVSFLVEYDNLFKNSNDARLNAGLRVYPAQSLNIDLLFSDIASPKKYETERILRIDYQTTF